MGALQARIRQLEAELKDANEMLAAIRKGEVDAFVVSGPDGDQVYTLKGADHPYRRLVQDMHEGALTLTTQGLILYANRRFSEMVASPLERVIGSHLCDFITDADRARAKALLRDGAAGAAQGEIGLKGCAAPVPALVSFNNLQIDDVRIVCLVVTDLTVQKRAEEILVSETLARAILEQAAEAVVVVDRAGKIVRASHAAAALAGNDVLLRKFDEAFPLCFSSEEGPVTGSANDFCAAALEGRTIRGVQAVLPRLAQPPAYILASAGPLAGPKGDSLGCVITLTDVTAHRRTEEELRASEERRRLAMEAAAVGTWNWDLRTRKLVWSEQCNKLFGFGAAEEVTYERFLDALHPEDRERVAAGVEHALRGGRYDTEYRVVWPDGSTHWIAARGRVETDSHGRPLRMQGTSLDIGERKRMDQELRQASDTVGAVISGAPVAIWLVDVSGRIAIWNPAAETLFGYNRDEALSRSGLFHLLTPPGADVLKRLANGEVIVGLEAVCARKEGEHVDISLSTSVLHNADGKSRGFVAIAVDVTEQKRLEEQMRQAQKLESVGLLAGGIAHDFNNILTGIIGNASLVAEDLPEDCRGRIDEVMRAGERAANLTRQLLAYAGKGQFYVEPVSLSAVVRGLMPLIQTSLPKKAEVRLDLDERLPAIEGDRSQIEQVVMNLLINAGEAVGEASGRITVRTWRQDLGAERAREYGAQPGRYSCIEVADSGCGMNEATKAKIFEPFFTTKFTGRGLGLAAVHGIVRSCRGAIRVESQSGQGTRFTVLLPAIQQPASEEAAEVRTMPPRSSGVVLVVDDEEMVRSTAEAALRRFGYTVITAADGREAVERFREAADRIDAVLLDVKMPVMDGEEALKEMKRIRAGVKVLVSSGYNEAEALRAFRGERVAGFVQKPYRAAELAEAVASLIHRGRKPKSHSVSEEKH